MTRRTTGRWSQIWRREIRRVALSALILAGASVDNRSCGDAEAPANAVTQTTSVWLDYHETGFSLQSLAVRITPQAAPFRQDPAPVRGRVTRGLLNFADGEKIPFLWQREEGRLHLDFNHNGDLSDDVAFSAVRPVQTYYQTFTNVHLPTETPLGRRDVLVDLNFSGNGSDAFCSASIRYFWQGKLGLAGREWQVGLIPNSLASSNFSGNTQLLLRDWKDRNQPFSVRDGGLDVIPLASRLCIDGRTYQLECTPQAQGGATAPLLKLTGRSVALGELKVTGKFIKRMVLSGSEGVVILDRPDGSVRIPVGSYGRPRVVLEQGGVMALNDGGQLGSPGRQITVGSSAPATVNAGGPLTNMVLVTLHGRDLRMDYRLVGADGEVYGLANPDYSRPPMFAIYRGDKEIASGKFEFG